MVNDTEKTENSIRAELSSNENSRFIAVSIAIFVVIFIYKDSIPTFLFGWIIGLLVTSLPLFYKSSEAFEKIAYRPNPKWKWFAKILHISATALEFNAIALLLYTISIELALFFFGITWLIEGIYTSLDIAERKKNFKKRIFKTLLFIGLQLLFGLSILLYYHFFISG